MNFKLKKIKIGFTTGDLNGIGVEIFLKVCLNKKFINYFTPVFFGSIKSILHYKNILNIKEKNINEIKYNQDISINKINVINSWKENKKISKKIDYLYSGEYPFLSLKKSIKFIKKGIIDVLVTSPVNKKFINIKNSLFYGHTDFLKNFLEGDPLMIMNDGNLRIALVTNHIPIKKICSILTLKKLKKSIKILIKSLKRDFLIRNPKIAVLGLNPHLGDNGLIGDEEKLIIIPAIEYFKNKNILISGPYSSDSFFRKENYKKYDAILSIYHDQGLIPFKILSNNGVNFTAGLSHIRTSPDHGVAYNIAKKGIANEKSMKNAIFTAIKIFNNRKIYDKKFFM